MKIISEPKGKAKEYEELSLNIYKGCAHACKYCYIPVMPWVKREDYYNDANPKADVLDKLSSDTPCGVKYLQVVAPYRPHSHSCAVAS